VHLDTKPHLVMSGAVRPTATCRRAEKAGAQRLENALAKRSVDDRLSHGGSEKQLAAAAVDARNSGSSRAPWIRGRFCPCAGRDAAPPNRVVTGSGPLRVSRTCCSTSRAADWLRHNLSSWAHSNGLLPAAVEEWRRRKIVHARRQCCLGDACIARRVMNDCPDMGYRMRAAVSLSCV